MTDKEYRNPRFNLGVVVQETGIQPDTLRSWERRYQLPNPQRSSGGQRLYSRYDIDLLKWLLKRLDEGERISQAVTQWRQLEAHGQDSLLLHPLEVRENDHSACFKPESSPYIAIDLPEEFTLPQYSGRSIVNIPSTICDWLGVPHLGAPPISQDVLYGLKNTYQHIILLVVDGLGWHMLQKMIQEPSKTGMANSIWIDILHDSLISPVTSVVPSTTTAALTALWTGLTPAETGMAGYELWLKEYGLVANMITHAPASFTGSQGSLENTGFKPTAWIPGPVMGRHLSANGIESYAFIPQTIAHSGFSSMQMQGSRIMPYVSTSDLWVTLHHLLQSRPRHRTFANVYWGMLDTLAHRYGPHDERIELEFAAFGMVLKDFLLSLKQQKRSNNTLLLMTAEHGLIHTPRLPVYDLKNYPALMDCMVMQPTGENRLSYIYLRNGMEVTFLRFVKEIWGEAFFMARSRDMVERGLFGTGQQEPHLASRLGDWVMAARGNAYCWWQEKENLMLGRHGGLSPDEMLVPLAGLVY